MKVLVNSWRDLAHPKAGGSEVVVDGLADALGRLGHDVVVRASGPLSPHEHYRAVSSGGTYSQYVRGPLERKCYRERDVVVDVNNGMAYYSPLVANLPSVAMVHHIHVDQWPLYFGAGVAAFGRLQETRLMPWAYRHSLILATSPSTAAGLIDLGVHPDRIRPLPLSCELPLVHTQRSAEPMFVACGRLTPHKRLDLLLELWERVRPHTGGRLVLIGDGPARTDLEALAGPGVEFVGRVTEAEKARLLGEAWVLLHTAPWEGWGLVISEAGRAETPSIGFDVRGVRDAIRDGHTGYTARSPGEMVERWLALAADRDLRATLGSAAQEYAASLSGTNQAQVFESVLEEAIELHHARAEGRRVHALPQGKRLVTTAAPAAPAATLDRNVELSIVIPAYNEALRLPSLLRELPHHVDPANTQVIVVDDGSTDDTTGVAERHVDGWPNASVITLDRNRGKGAALRAGVREARGRHVAFMDADLATDLADLPSLRRALDHSHVAIGSRTDAASSVENGATHRRIMAKIFSTLVRSVTDVEVLDSQCGFKAFRGPVARLLFHLSEVDGFAQDVEILDLAARMRFDVAEVPVRWTAVPGSKVEPIRHAARMAYDVVRHRTSPVNAAVLTGITVPASELASVVVAKEAASVLRATDPVLDDGHDVHILLPGVDRRHVPAIGQRLAGRIGTSALRTWTLDARSLLRLTQSGVGSALAGIGEPLG